MKLIHAIVPAAALSLFGTAAIAQDAGGAAAPSQPPAAQAPATPQGGASASVTDAEVGQFVKAVTAVQAIAKDPATPAADKQTKMAAAVQQTGLPPERFNQIASASQSDPALMQRIQAAAAKPQG